MGIRSHRLWIARIVLALMFFAQGAMVWSACDLPEHSPVRAVLASAEVAPCHESGFGGACLTYCLSDRQAVQKAGMDIPAMPPAPVLTLALQLDPVPFTGVTYLSEAALGTGPPRRILLQSFQI
jgi:hypothetical protein